MNELINSTDVITGVTTSLCEDAIKAAWGKVKKFFKDMSAQESIDFGDAYEKYLTKTKSKYCRIKTLIYRRTPRDLYSFYECMGLCHEGKTIDTSNVNNVLNIGKKIIISGTGGIGKSTMLKHLFVNTIENTEYIPVLIELRSFNALDTKEVSVYDMIYKLLSDNGFNIEKEYFEYSMNSGGYILLFDGYDELNRDKSSKIASEIRCLSDKYSSNYYIVSSRPSDAFIGWNDFSEVTINPLTKEQAISLIKKIDFDERVKEKFISELERYLFVKYRSFAQNPLLLTIMLLTYENNATIPDNLNDFYELAFSTLFNMHDATKDSFVRDIRTGLGCEDFKKIFAYVCFKSYFANDFEFSDVTLTDYLHKAQEKFDKIQFKTSDFQDDLTQSVCMLVKDGLVYHFSHRSFQEYFAAWYTCKLTDDIQTKLLTAKIKESESIFMDNYFPMLFNLQAEKVNKIILLPGIKKLKEYYERDGFSIKLLKRIFSGVVFQKEYISKGKVMKYHTSLSIKDRYICNVCILATNLNGYISDVDNTDERFNSICKKVFDHSQNGRLKIEFEKLQQILSDDDILYAVEWFKSYISFLIKLYEKYNSSSSNKRKVLSILEDI